MNIKAVSVKCFELFAPDGTSLGLFKVESEWQGMRKLVSVDDVNQSVIVNAPGSEFEKVFGSIFGEHRGELELIKASPEIIAKVKQR